jgi:hypothetical protein
MTDKGEVSGIEKIIDVLQRIESELKSYALEDTPLFLDRLSRVTTFPDYLMSSHCRSMTFMMHAIVSFAMTWISTDSWPILQPFIGSSLVSGTYSNGLCA